jgi:hypothetical protein
VPGVIYIDRVGVIILISLSCNIDAIPHSESKELSPTGNRRKFCLSVTLMKIAICDKLNYLKYSNYYFYFGIYKYELSLFSALPQYKY